MSDLKSRKASVEIGGVVYNLAFNLNVLDAFLEKYGTLQDMIAAIDPSGKTMLENAGTVIWVLHQMICEDIDERMENGEEIKPMTLKGLKRKVRLENIPAIRDAIAEALAEGLPKPKEENEKN